jgi:hypothetical protein
MTTVKQYRKKFPWFFDRSAQENNGDSEYRVGNGWLYVLRSPGLKANWTAYAPDPDNPGTLLVISAGKRVKKDDCTDVVRNVRSVSFRPKPRPRKQLERVHAGSSRTDYVLYKICWKRKPAK